ncbi:putative ribonuclease H-like domain-containing protein [Tanacetum coccineum]
MTENIKLLINFVWKFLGTVHFRNDHIAAILGYGDLKWGNITIARVYFVKGLGHNLFSVGQFCDADLEVTFRRNTCFIKDLDSVDLLKGNRTTNLYTINLYGLASTSPICLMAHATPTKSWLWHQRLSHLNFDTINDLAKNDLVSGLPNSELKAAASSASYGFVWSNDEIPEVIKNFLKNIYVRLQAPVIIVRTDNRAEFKSHTLNEYFDSVGIIHETSVTKTPQQNGLVKRRNHALVEAARTMLIFFHAPLFLWAKAIATAALCYLKNDCEDIGKLGAKGDIGFFIGYSANSVAYRVSGLELTYAPSIITPQKPSERDLDILFESLHNEYFGGQPSKAPRTVPAAPVIQNLQAPTASMTIQDSALTPTNSSNTPNSSHNVDEQSQQHAQQQGNHTLLPTASAADNVSNAVFKGDLFVNPFATPSTESAESSTQNVDPSNMHTFYQPYPYDYKWTKDHPLELVIGEPSRPVLTRNQLKTNGDMCIYALIVSIMEPKTVKEALTDPAWIESMKKELHQFIRFDVWELVPSPDGIKPLTLKWLFKNKHDEENTVIHNKSRLVVRGYRQEEGIDFE